VTVTSLAGAPAFVPGTAVTRGVSDTARAGLGEIDGRTVSWFALGGGPHRGAIGEAEGIVVERAVRLATELGVPVVGTLATSGAEVGAGVVGLHAWGRVARELTRASGVVPIVLTVTGPCVSGPALMLALADHVVMTADAFAYVSGPDAVAQMTGMVLDHRQLGGPAVHATRTGLASLVVESKEAAEDAVADLLSFLPSNHLEAEHPPVAFVDDPVDRECDLAATAIPERATASYDVRDVVRDVLDVDTFLEVRARNATNIVTAYGRLGGRAVAVVANQPCQRAGTIDISASHKAARFVQSCDAFNLPIVTFVDTPGFEPGKELEWRGMIRHGAQLVHAYAEATVPRLCVVLRKAYGGAYIVMDSKGMGNDYCVAWPSAEIAVMGASGAVAVLFGRRLAEMDDGEKRGAERVRLEDEYAATYLSPWLSAERGLVDEVIEPSRTRSVLIDALRCLVTKRDGGPQRRHSNGPL